MLRPAVEVLAARDAGRAKTAYSATYGRRGSAMRTPEVRKRQSGLSLEAVTVSRKRRARR